MEFDACNKILKNIERDVIDDIGNAIKSEIDAQMKVDLSSKIGWDEDMQYAHIQGLKRALEIIKNS